MVNKYAYIQTKTGYVAIDANTQFLYRGKDESSSFKTCTGMNELPTFQAKATIDVVYGSNGVAKYVYIIGTVESAYDSNFILVTGKTYGATLKTTANGINYYEVTLVVPFEGTVTLKVKADNFALVEKLTGIAETNGYSKLFYVSYTDGYATSAVEIGKDANPYNYNGADGRAIMLTGASYSTSGKVISAAYGDSVLRFNITEATVIVGDLSNGLKNKVVYVIYDSTNLNCSKVYVCDIDQTQTGTTYPTAPDSVMLTYSVKMIDASGKELNTVVMGTQKHVGAVGAQSIAYKSVVEAMKNDATEANWTNAEGAVALMTAMGIYDADLKNVAPVVVADTAVGNAVSLTFVVKVQ